MGYRKGLPGIFVSLAAAALLAGCALLSGSGEEAPPASVPASAASAPAASAPAGGTPALTLLPASQGAGRTVLAAPLEVTVGEGGQFATLGEALRYCSGFYPSYQQEGCAVTVRILEGTVLREQIVCSAIDLSYITITADQTDGYPQVPVEHTAAWTGDRDESRYNKPFLEANNGGRLPLVGCVFALASENNDENGYACGMLCDKGSVGTVLDGGGFVGFFDGVVANNNSEITCRNGVLQDCGRYAVQARHLSRVSVRGADLSGAGQCAVYANRVSQVDARAAWSAGSRNGLLAANDSTINANDATFQGLWGEYIAAADALSTVNCGNLVVDDYYGAGPCFQVRNGSQMALHGLSGNLWEGQAPLYSQQPNQLTGEGILYVGEGEGYDDP